jgi:hypothetical protein
MKRLTWLLLAVCLSFSTVGFAAPPSPRASIPTDSYSPPAGIDPAAPAAYMPGDHVVCHEIRAKRLCVSVSEGSVRPGSYVTIYGMMKDKGVGVPGMIMNVIWASNVTVTCVGITDADGLASCTTYVPASTLEARKVYVKVHIDHFKLLTFFLTRRSPDLESED